MGLSYHKSVKLFGNTRLNISKNGGIGISTGVKGARVSVNKQGVRTSVGGHGLYYRKQESWKKKSAGSKPDTQIPLTAEEIKSNPEALKQYNQNTLNTVEGKAFKWFVVVMVLAIILGALTATVGFWILFVIDCIVFLWFTVSGVRRMLQYDKEGKMLFKD